MSIHQKIKAGRLRLQLTHAEFGDKVGVSRGAVQQWEVGSTAPSRKRQPKVAQLLGISVSELMDPTDADTTGAPSTALRLVTADSNEPPRQAFDVNLHLVPLGVLLASVPEERKVEALQAMTVLLIKFTQPNTSPPKTVPAQVGAEGKVPEKSR